MTSADKRTIQEWAEKAHPDWWAQTEERSNQSSAYHACLLRLVEHMAEEDPERAMRLSCRTMGEANAKVRIQSELLGREVVLGDEYTWAEVASLRSLSKEMVLALDRTKRVLNGEVLCNTTR